MIEDLSFGMPAVAVPIILLIALVWNGCHSPDPRRILTVATALAGRSHPAGPGRGVSKIASVQVNVALPACDLFGRAAIHLPNRSCSRFLGALRICFDASAGTVSSDGGAFGCGPPGPPRASAS